LSIHNKKLSFYCGEGVLYNKDSIEIILITEKNIIHRMYTVCIENAERGVIQIWLNKDEEKMCYLQRELWKLDDDGLLEQIFRI